MPTTYTLPTNHVDNVSEVIHASTINNAAAAINDLSTRAGSMALTVAASNAPQSIKDRADYICDGTADEVEINAAINALPLASGDTSNGSGSLFIGGGGTVFLSGGLFTLANPIEQNRDTVSIVGSGFGTAIQPVSGFVGTYLVRYDRPNASFGALPLGRPAQYCGLSNLRLDGVSHRNNASAGAIDGLLWKVQQGYVDHVWIQGFSGYGLHIQGYTYTSGGTFWSTAGSDFNQVRVRTNLLGGVIADTHGEDCFLHDSQIYENPATAPSGTTAHGLQLQSGAWSITDNMFWGNSGKGIYLVGTGDTLITIEGNRIEQNNGGIEIDGGTWISIVGNEFTSNSWTTTNTNDDIWLNGPDSNNPNIVNIYGNVFSNAHSGNQSRYNINITHARSVNIDGNIFSGAGTAAVNQTEAGSTSSIDYANVKYGSSNVGYITRKGGLYSAQPGAVTTITIAHGLARTPDIVSVTPKDSTARALLYTGSGGGGVTNPYFVTVDATNITLTFTAALVAATTYSFNWYAEATK